jgi:hypothetical protein
VKKAIIFSVVAFVISLAGATGARVTLYHPPAPDSTVAHADGTTGHATGKPGGARDGTMRDSMTTASGGADSGRKDSTRATLVAHDSATPALAATTPPVPVHPMPPKPAVDPAARAAAYKQVARVLSAMKPPEAAKVLGLMTDVEVEGILRAVGPRQAADFLTNMPKERAAALSRRLLVPQVTGGAS